MTYTWKIIRRSKLGKIGQIIETECKMSEYDAYKAAHPELERYIGEVPIWATEGNLQPPSDFQHGVLDRIRRTVPGALKGMADAKFKTTREW